MKQVLPFITRCVEILAWVMIFGTVGRLDVNTVALYDGLIICVVCLIVALIARMIRRAAR